MKNRFTQNKFSFLIKVMTTTSLVALAVPVLANPQGGVVAAGDVTIAETGKTMTINQNTINGVVDWQSFNVQNDEIVNINQISNKATLVNRIHDVNPSFIGGQLNANGNVVLLNTNGVVFGSNARVDVNGLIASTARLDGVAPFMEDGSLSFTPSGEADGFVANYGLITAGEAGLVGFVSPHVENHGVILAKLGRVHLASGDTATVDFNGDGLIQVAVSDAVSAQSVINTGRIEASGGLIALTAAAGKNIVDSLIVAAGELKAPHFKQESGKIVIYGEGSTAVIDNQTALKTIKQGQSTVIVDGLLDVSGNDTGQTGGQIDILGDSLIVLNHAVINASGDQGGGQVKIGGDYLGTGLTPTAHQTYIDDQALIVADARDYGDGGRVIVWSDDTTAFHGAIFARGGVRGGNGGFVETSGKENLKADGYVDLTARHETGDKGTYLLDPSDITIYGNFTPTDLAGNVLWLDGADKNTILDSNGNAANDDGFSSDVATWLDKSGNGNDLSNDAISYQPNYVENNQNGNGVIRFDGDDSLYVTDSDVPSLDISGNALSYFGVINPSDYLQSQTLLVKDESFGLEIHRGKMQAFVETNDPGYWGKDGNTATLSQWQQMGFEHADTAWNFYQNGALTESLSPKNHETGAITPSDKILAVGGRGTETPVSDFFNGDMAEVLVYDQVLDQSSKNLLSQYQAAKWDISLNPSGTGADEVAKATATDGYGEFTTRYLERLSDMADIQLQASNNITLDLKGDTLNLAQDRNLSLQTTSGDITSISGGSIVSNRVTNGGNIQMNAGGVGNIDLSDMTLYANNNGKIKLRVDTGMLAYHQNYVAPSPLPETVINRPLDHVNNVNIPVLSQKTLTPPTLVSFTSDFDGGLIGVDDDAE